MKQLFKYSLLVTLSFFIACGGIPGFDSGGGGDSNDGNPAEVRLKAEPQRIDSGDIVTVEVRITNVSKPFVLKIKHHENLTYVPDSMILFGDGNPGPNIPTPTDFGIINSSTRYLVVPFYAVPHFGERGKGTLSFNFQGTGETNDTIEIDADDGLVEANGLNFNPRSPQFSTLDEVRVRVNEDEGFEEDTLEEEEDEDEDTEEDDEDDEDEEEDTEDE
jgi:hypothetical protein